MVTILDLRRITQLLINTSMLGKIQRLERKLYHAEIIEPEAAPGNLVTMNSEVIIDDLTKAERNSIRLVYQISPLYGSQASILAPLGTALLGMKVNDTAHYTLRDGSTRTIRVAGILFQPEAQKQFDL